MGKDRATLESLYVKQFAENFQQNNRPVLRQMVEEAAVIVFESKMENSYLFCHEPEFMASYAIAEKYLGKKNSFFEDFIKQISGCSEIMREEKAYITATFESAFSLLKKAPLPATAFAKREVQKLIAFAESLGRNDLVEKGNASITPLIQRKWRATQKKVTATSPYSVDEERHLQKMLRAVKNADFEILAHYVERAAEQFFPKEAKESEQFCSPEFKGAFSVALALLGSDFHLVESASAVFEQAPELFAKKEEQIKREFDGVLFFVKKVKKEQPYLTASYAERLSVVSRMIRNAEMERKSGDLWYKAVERRVEMETDAFTKNSPVETLSELTIKQFIAASMLVPSTEMQATTPFGSYLNSIAKEVESASLLSLLQLSPGTGVYRDPATRRVDLSKRFVFKTDYTL